MDGGADSFRRYLEGDESAFDEILDLYRENLIFFINRYVNDLAAAEDLAIDAFMELIVHRQRYNFKASLKTYLFTIGRNRALNFIKRRSKIRFVPLDEVQEKPADSGLPEESAIARERTQAVNAALSRLPEKMRTAVYLIYFEGLSYGDAARVMNLNQKQVDNLLYRAKNALRADLGEEGEIF